MDFLVGGQQVGDRPLAAVVATRLAQLGMVMAAAVVEPIILDDYDPAS
jgi:hypothetical protein